jgi:hypothetical protein
MKQTGIVLSLCLAGASFLGRGALPAISQSSPPLPVQLAQQSPDTLLYFETATYVVRVFQRSGSPVLNVYNKRTDDNEQNRVAVVVAAPRSSDDGWRTYTNQSTTLEYLARVSPTGETELEIYDVQAKVRRRESGFNATFSFPHTLLGQNISTVLTTLRAEGWAVAGATSGVVQLTREQTRLHLKTDLETRAVNYAQLIDLSQ